MGFFDFKKFVASDVPGKVGKTIEKEMDVAIAAVEKATEAIKEYNNLSSKFSAPKNQKEFIRLKKEEESLYIKSQQAIKAEQQAIQSVERTKQTLLRTEQAQARAVKRNTTLSAVERKEKQQAAAAARRLATISSSLSTAYEKQSAILTNLRRKYKGIAIEYGVNSKEARKLQREISSLDTKLKKVDAAAGQFQRNVGNYPSAFKGAAGALRNLAGAAGLLGGAFLAVRVAREAFNTLREFDRQVIAIGKTTNITGKELRQLGKDIVSLGNDTKGVSIQGLAKSAEVAGQLGVKGSANILKFSKTIEQLKLTSDIVGDESVQSFAKFIEVSEDSVENADRLGSVITALGNNFATTESQVLSNSQKIQQATTRYSTNAEEVLALGAATNSLGLEADKAASGIDTAFRVLDEAANTGKNLNAVLEITGQTAEEFRKEFGTNAVQSFNRFVRGVNEAQDEGRTLSSVLNDVDIVEKRALATVGSLAKNYDVLNNALSIANKEYAENEALLKEAEAATESLDSKIGDLGDSYDALVLSIDQGTGPVSRFFGAILEGLQQVTEGYRILFTSQEQLNREQDGRLFEQGKQQALDIIERARKQGKADLEQLSIFADEAEKAIAAKEARLKILETRRDSLGELEGTSDFDAGGFILTKEAIEEVKGSLAQLNGEYEIYVAEEQKLKKSTKETNEVRRRTVQVIKAEIAELSKALDQTTTNAEAEPIQDRIALRQKEIEAILGVAEAKKKANKDTTDRGGAFRLLEQRLQQEIRLEREISQNKTESLEERLAAEERAVDFELDLNELRKKNALESEKAIGVERTRIIEEFEAKRKAIVEKASKETGNIAVSSVEFDIQDRQADLEAQINAEIEAENRKIQSAEERERAIAKIKKKYAIEALEAQIQAIEVLLQNENISAEQRKEYERQLAQFRSDLSALYKTEVEDGFQKFAEAFEEVAANVADVFNSLSDITSGFTQRRIDDIERQQERNNEYYASLLSQEKLSQEQRDILEQERLRKERELEKKKRKEQEKQAKIEKATAVVNASIATAVAIIKAVAASPLTGGLPFSAIAAAIGAAQIAAIIAQPIPKFKDGHEQGTYEGWALTGDGGRSEIIERKGGNVEKTPAVDTLTYINKGDKVFSSVPRYEQVKRAAMMTSIQMQTDQYNQASATSQFDYNLLIQEQKTTQSEIKELTSVLRGKKMKVINKGFDFEHLKYLKDNI